MDQYVILYISKRERPDHNQEWLARHMESRGTMPLVGVRAARASALFFAGKFGACYDK